MMYGHAIKAIYAEPWAIRREGWHAVHQILLMHVDGRLAQFDDRIQALPRVERPTEGFFGDKLPQMRMENGVAVIPIKGTMIKGAGLIEKSCGVVSHEDIAADIAEARRNGARGIVLDINSPGGTVQGTPELAEDIASLVRGGMDVYAFTDELMASAAYYTAAGASGIFATRSAQVGSIGVIWETYNVAEQLAQRGIEVNVFTSGPFKGLGHPATRLTEEQAAWMQSEVDRLADEFKAHVRAGRPSVQEYAMQGQCMDGTQAVSAGLINGVVRSIDDVLALFN